VATVAIPQSIAYASIAELPPHYGLYASVVAGIVGGLWSSSRHLSAGPTNGMSLLVLSVLLPVVAPGSVEYLLAASVLAVLAGVLLVGFAWLRFGALVTLASRAVLLGFTAGAAVLIALGQLKNLLGIQAPSSPQLYRTLVELFARADTVDPASLVVGLSTLVAIVGLRLLHPRIPATLLAVAGAAVAVWALALDQSGVAVIGPVPRSPPQPTPLALGRLPDFELVRNLTTGAMAVAALALVESVAIAQTLARKSGHRLDNNQQFFALGLGNVVAGLFSGYPSSGSLTRSALSQQAGGRTQLSGVFMGLWLLLAMLAFAPAARFIPRPALAAVLLVVAWGMVDRASIRRVAQTSRAETLIMVATALATLSLPLEFAVLSGVLLSLAYFIVQSSLPRVFPVVPDASFRHFVQSGDSPVCPQLGVMTIRGPLFFGAVHHVEQALRQNLDEHPGQSILLLRMHGVEICDLNGIEMLEETLRTYRDLGGDLYLVRPRAPVLDTMASSGFVDRLGADHILQQEDAIEHLFEKVLDPGICIYECEHKVFAECHSLPKHPYGEELPTYDRRAIDPARHLSVADFRACAADRPCLVIDVREQREFEQGHLPGARLVPLRLLLAAAPSLPRDRALLLVCRSGRRSSRAMAMLYGVGREDSFNLKGGVLAWRAAGLPLADGPDPSTPLASSTPERSSSI
jgi:SulP family sulfate permease